MRVVCLSCGKINFTSKPVSELFGMRCRACQARLAWNYALVPGAASVIKEKEIKHRVKVPKSMLSAYRTRHRYFELKYAQGALS